MVKYAAHPTLYKGIMFRSRLEAKWAAYFDARGWAWVYEPFDLLGYTPDFSVTIYPDGEFLTEVKPATKLSHLSAPIARILKAGWKGPWLVVGADPDIAMTGRGRHQHRRRFLGRETPLAWAHASNVTQWRPDLAVCASCGLQDHPLHKRLCKGSK